MLAPQTDELTMRMSKKRTKDRSANNTVIRITSQRTVDGAENPSATQDYTQYLADRAKEAANSKGVTTPSSTV